MQHNRHVIGKTTLDLHVKSSQTAPFDFERQVNRFCHERLLPELERIFDGFVNEGEVISIGKLELDFSNLPAHDWEESLLFQLQDTLKKQLEKRLSAQDPEDRIERRPVMFSRFESWAFFLQHGALPAHTGSYTEEEMETAVLETVASQVFAVEQFKRLIINDLKASERLLWQHRPAFLQSLAQAVGGKNLDEVWEFVEATAAEVAVAWKQSTEAPLVEAWASKPELFRSKTVFRQFLEAIVWRDFLATDTLVTPTALWELAIGRFLKKEKWPEAVASLRGFLSQKKEEGGLFVRAVKTWLDAQPTIAAHPHFPKENKQELQGPKEAELTQAEKSPQPAEKNLETHFEKKTEQENPATGPFSEEEKKEQADRTENQSVVDKPGVENGDEIAPASSKNAETGAAENPQQPAHSPDAIFSKKEKSRTDRQANNGEDLTSGLRAAPMENQPSEGRPFRTPADKKHWYLPCAGVVLLHPFLPALFKALGFLDEKNKFLEDEKQERAVHLVHFLASGQEQAAEHEMVFAKFLCGFDLQTPLHRDIPLTTEEKAECEGLLKAAIQHWAKLGNVSPDGLRGNFLLRPGKLSYSPSDGWLLQMEQQAWDILLNQLPWGIGVVRLPWLPAMLMVEWNY